VLTIELLLDSFSHAWHLKASQATEPSEEAGAQTRRKPPKSAERKLWIEAASLLLLLLLASEAAATLN
jgi:hypothetical protein